ncbi:MAG TPA: class I SAM-dependent methyltransferase [Mycobacteriales bacterium]|nr:class I SAM-dependent methyltransferase [Mycobacteriales bacterium]
MSIGQAGALESKCEAGLVAETIATYDLGADVYGRRFAQVDMGVYLDRFAELIPLGSITLDAGCGSGRDLAWLRAQGIRAVGLDRSTGMLRLARRSVQGGLLVRGDLRRLPFSAATFGGVWQCASLVHLSRPQTVMALAEVERVLTPGGVVFLSVATGGEPEWRASYAGRRWFHYYDGGDLNAMLQSVGLTVLTSATEPGVVRGSWVNVFARKAR